MKAEALQLPEIGTVKNLRVTETGFRIRSAANLCG